jgi:hypothetical protein
MMSYGMYGDISLRNMNDMTAIWAIWSRPSEPRLVLQLAERDAYDVAS